MKLNEKCALILNPYAALNIPNHINRKRHDSSDHDSDTWRTYLEITWAKLIITNETKIIQSKNSKGFLKIYFNSFILNYFAVSL